MVKRKVKTYLNICMYMTREKRWGKRYKDKRDWKEYNEHLIKRGEYYVRKFKLFPSGRGILLRLDPIFYTLIVEIVECFYSTSILSYILGTCSVKVERL
jgi:hypothetical protein